MKCYNVTYKIVGTVTLPVVADSPESANEEALREYPETDINFNRDLVVLDRKLVSIDLDQARNHLLDRPMWKWRETPFPDRKDEECQKHEEVLG